MTMRAAAAALACAVAGTATPACAAPPADQQADTAALAFVDSVFRRQAAEQSVARDGHTFTAELVALLQRETAESERRKEIFVIDYDLVCACQDDAGLTHEAWVTARTATTADVGIDLGYAGGDTQTVLWKLRLEPAGWRIADISLEGERGESLLATLRKELAALPRR